MAKKGFFPGYSTFNTFIFTFKGLLKRLPVRRVVPAESRRTDYEHDVYVRTFSGGSGTEFIPGRGTVLRPCVVGFRGVLAKRKVKKDFTVTPVRSLLPAKLGTQVLTTTGCPLSTGGVGKNISTDQLVFITIINGNAGDRKTAWEVF